MKVNQVANIVNTAYAEVMGTEGVVNEDLSNVVDAGTNLYGAGDKAVDSYVKAILNKVGKMVFVDRPYAGAAPSVLMDGWEYGSVCEKVRREFKPATVNETWSLVNGVEYPTNIFHEPNVSAKTFNKRVTFEFEDSIVDRQLKQSFSNAGEMSRFTAMLFNGVQNDMTISMDNLIRRTINNFIGETIFDAYKGTNLNGGSHLRAVNLLYVYNTEYNTGTALTADNCLNNPDFIKFVAFTMSNYIDRIKAPSRLFNIGGFTNFTPTDRLSVILRSDVKNAANIYLQSSTFHEVYTALPNSETMVYWQGSGTEYNEVGKIDIVTSSGNNVTVDNVIGVMFDRDALGVTNLDRRVTTNYVASAEFWNYYHKFDAGYFNDFNENFIVFFVA